MDVWKHIRRHIYWWDFEQDAWKGDSPLIGCGTYADNGTAGVSVTGYGESIMKVTLARRVCANLEEDSA